MWQCQSKPQGTEYLDMMQELYSNVTTNFPAWHFGNIKCLYQLCEKVNVDIWSNFNRTIQFEESFIDLLLLLLTTLVIHAVVFKLSEFYLKASNWRKHYLYCPLHMAVEAAVHRWAPSRLSQDPRRSERWGEAATGFLTTIRPSGVAWSETTVSEQVWKQTGNKLLTGSYHLKYTETTR